MDRAERRRKERALGKKKVLYWPKFSINAPCKTCKKMERRDSSAYCLGCANKHFSEVLNETPHDTSNSSNHNEGQITSPRD